MSESKDIKVLPDDAVYAKISEVTEYSPEQVAVIQKAVAKNTTAVELAYFLNVCKSVGLNPFLKEIWCYKDKKKNLLVFAGRDGFLSKAQMNPRYAGIRSCEIRENDEFSVDVANKKVNHTITGWGSERGAIKGAYAIVFVKEGEPTIELADFQTYNKGWNVWKSHPAEMIKKVAETHALKKALGITGIQTEEDFNIKNGVATPIEIDKPKSLIEEVKLLRDGLESQFNDETFLGIICELELGKGKAETEGERNHIVKILNDKKYNLSTGELNK